MKNIILIVIICVAAWQYFVKSPSKSQKPYVQSTQEAKQSTEIFTCDGREHCSEMTSRAEAVYFINHCPNTKMDGDHDGVPCENDSRF
jgi:hypothetical protein